MNAFSFKGSVVAKVLAALAVLAILVSIAPQITLAAPTAVSSTPSSLTVAAGEKVFFKVTVTNPDVTRPLVVSDNGAGGTFYNGNINSESCSSQDTTFSISGNKGVCYSNATPGNYVITADVLEVGSTTVLLTVDVTVEVADDSTPQGDGSGTENDPYTNPNGNVDICHATGNDGKYVSNSPDISSIVNETAHSAAQAVHENDIIPAFWYQLNGATTPALYIGRNTDKLNILSNGCIDPNPVDTSSSTDDGTGTSTDDGTGTSTDNGTGTSTNDGTGTSTDDGTGTSTDDGTGTSTDDGTSTSTDDGTNNEETPAPGCEFEAHKYNQFGTPLANWAIGLMKIITHNNGVDTYILDEENTDEDGYVCLAWDGEYRVAFDEVTPSYVDGEYDFSYWLYERMKDGWMLNSIEMGEVGALDVVSADDIVYGDHLVRVQYGEDNGIIPNDAAYHIDFYNLDPNATSTDDNATTTEEVSTSTDPVTGGGGGSSRRSSRSSGTRVTPEPQVLGISDSPTPLVLGEQVSAVPLGGANTGAGGSTTANTEVAFAFLLVLAGAIVGARRYNG